MVTKRSQIRNKNKGSLVLEVLIVSSIITVSILAALFVAQQSISVSRQAVHQSQASFLLEEGAEAVRILRDNSWAGVSNLTIDTEYYLLFSGGTWTFSTTPSSVGVFTRKVVFSRAYRDGNQDLATSGTEDTLTRLVTVNVSWVKGSQVFSKDLQFYIADIFS